MLLSVKYLNIDKTLFWLKWYLYTLYYTNQHSVWFVLLWKAHFITDNIVIWKNWWMKQMLGNTLGDCFEKCLFHSFLAHFLCVSFSRLLSFLLCVLLLKEQHGGGSTSPAGQIRTFQQNFSRSQQGELKHQTPNFPPSWIPSKDQTEGQKRSHPTNRCSH